MRLLRTAAVLSLALLATAFSSDIKAATAGLQRSGMRALSPPTRFALSRALPLAAAPMPLIPPTQQASAPESWTEMRKSAKLAASLGAWYAVSAMFNIYNKRALTALNMPWSVALVQLGAGLLVFIPMWVLNIRANPFSSMTETTEMLGALKHITLFAAVAHISGIMALGLGTVSFTQVVKAAEPLFTALLGGVCFGDLLPLRSLLALMPVVAGVCMASVSELSFTWPCLLSGILSNLFSGARNVYSKRLMRARIPSVQRLSAENLYSVLTVFCFVLLAPVTLLAEWPRIASFAARGARAALTAAELRGARDALVSGVLFYVYNEMSFRVLSEVSPVSHALANTMKRVVIILSSVLVFQNKMTSAGLAGSALAMLGTFLYAVAK